ncbi:hypothetical protein N7E01_09220 [Neopusillimonas aromaticivorans]|nr:hypothetical protein [Neopusillimonas aromaticivorans]WJJ92551.1 hypothetical protein N7E01_09220 [Neopusillimonas aromaticivorans]
MHHFFAVVGPALAPGHGDVHDGLAHAKLVKNLHAAPGHGQGAAAIRNGRTALKDDTGYLVLRQPQGHCQPDRAGANDDDGGSRFARSADLLGADEWKFLPVEIHGVS